LPLIDRLPSGFPNRDRLEHCERTLAANERGLRVCDNFAVALDDGLLDQTLFQGFCARLGERLPPPGERCEDETAVRTRPSKDRSIALSRSTAEGLRWRWQPTSSWRW
jgi:hypothetical protein